MKKILKSALVSYSSAQMYTLVNDVAHYADFLPWCRATEVLTETSVEMTASVTISKAGVTKSFTTHNKLIENQQIIMKLVEGPLKTLEGVWTFQAIGDLGCKVTLDLSFEFKAGLVNKAFQKIFEPIAANLVDAFCQRAEDLYGHD